MKTIIAICTAVFFTALSWGQTYSTGDKGMDANLKTINVEANKNLAQFKLDITKTFNTTPVKVNSMFSIGMSAGDIYFAFEISNIGRRPIDDVITCYKKNKGKGWGVMAKELGIKPGSAEFHALKGKCKNKSSKKAVAATPKKPATATPATKSNGNSKGNGNGNGNGNGKKK